MKVRYSPRAIGDLEAIADYLVPKSPQGALAVEMAIRATIDLLAVFPGGGRALEQRPNVRVIPVVRFDYLIFYTVADSEVVILHIRHGSRQTVDPHDL